MSTPISGNRQAKRIILAQTVVTALIAVAFAVFAGAADAVAALVGGLINVVANLYFARKLFGGRSVKSTTEMVLGFFVGEAVKLFITIALLALAIGVFKLSFLPLLITFVATLLVFWFTPVLDRFFGSRA